MSDPTLFSDLDEMEASLPYIDDWRKVIKELRAARTVVEAAKAVIESLNPMFVETDAVIVKLHDALLKLDESRRG